MLIKNHFSRPTSSAALPEVNANFARFERGSYGGFKGLKITNFERQQTKNEPEKINNFTSENKKHYEEVCYRCGRYGN